MKIVKGLCMYFDSYWFILIFSLKKGPFLPKKKDTKRLSLTDLFRIKKGIFNNFLISLVKNFHQIAPF